MSREPFPDPRLADAEGVVAVGGPFTAERLLAAYRLGIFPWSGNPVRWHCPDPRSIFWEVRLPRKLGKSIRRRRFRVSYDRAFAQVVQACADHHREAGEWITPAFVSAYADLHGVGYAHSVEVWQDGRLVGGLYGVQVAGLFAGESMFYHVTDASKVAFAALAYHLDTIGTVLFDCQVINAHTYRLGAVLVRRDDYLRLLDYALQLPVPFDGVLWPAGGCADLTGTPLEGCAETQPQPVTLRRGQRDQTPGTGPMRFWSLQGQSNDASGE